MLLQSYNLFHRKVYKKHPFYYCYYIIRYIFESKVQLNFLNNQYYRKEYYFHIAIYLFFNYASKKQKQPNYIYNKRCSFEHLLSIHKISIYLYSSQLFTGISFKSILQNARINALARRAFVIRGILWSIAARRIL